jgi:small GTP-binding protein
MKTNQYKICLLGDFAVGKTSLIRRYVEGSFDDRYLSTIGVKVSRAIVETAETSNHLYLWDLAGGDTFSKYQASYLKGAAGGVIVCDLTRRVTLDLLSDYAEQLRAANPKASIIFVGNKLDLSSELQITEVELKVIVDRYQASLFLTSAKTGHQVISLFETLVRAFPSQQQSG